jgi:bacteriorhodopsin
MNYVNVTALGSLGFQFLTGVIETHGVFLNVPPESKIVQEILTMELLVQIVEFLFYSYLVYMILTNQVTSFITSHRYADWAITTPFMLISFVLFFKYLNNPKRGIGFFESMREEQTNISKIVIANALMLLFGFLAERNIISTVLGVTVGFVPFIYMFYKLYDEYAKYDAFGRKLFYILALIWSLYGVAAYMPFASKNTFYNILDLFAKNAYGLFLYFYLRSKTDKV